MSVVGITERESVMAKRVSDDIVETAWRKARPISGRDPALFRIAPDVIRSVIRRDQYNVRDEFGWRIECGIPVAYRAASTEAAIRSLEFEGLHANTDRYARRDPSRG